MMMVRRVRTARHRQLVAVYKQHHFNIVAALARPNHITAIIDKGKCRVDKASRFIECAFISQLVDIIDEHIPQDFIATSLLKPSMPGLVV
jgi:hypothetical protein